MRETRLFLKFTGSSLAPPTQRFASQVLCAPLNLGKSIIRLS